MKKVLLTAFAMLCLGAQSAQAETKEVKREEFLWRADLTLPAQAGSVVRLNLPLQAMVHLQTSSANDLRVFNAQGEVVPYAILPFISQPAANVPTHYYAAHPLMSNASAPAGDGLVQVHVENQQAKVWTKLTQSPRSAAPALTGTPLPMVLFDTRKQDHAVTGLTLQGRLPPNVLVHVQLASSADLTHWTPIPVKGPIFEFKEGGGASQHTLELVQPYALAGKYLRLSWEGQEGVQVTGLTAYETAEQPRPPRLSLPLSSLVNADKTHATTQLEWTLGFATPLAALQLSTTLENTWLPVRILGQAHGSRHWRELARTVVYRLNIQGKEIRNAAVSLGGASVQKLRLETLNKATLPTNGLQASVEFDPLELLFVSTGQGPFQLAAGHPQTADASVSLKQLSKVFQGDVRTASIASVGRVYPPPEPSALERWLPDGFSAREFMLLVILTVAVFVLCFVVYVLYQQLKIEP